MFTTLKLVNLMDKRNSHNSTDGWILLWHHSASDTYKHFILVKFEWELDEKLLKVCLAALSGKVN
jgi:hypothetical protein